jgi:hypothetical protein
VGARFARGRVVAALAVLALSAAVSPASGASCANRVKKPDGWTRIAAPDFTSGSGSLMTYDAADPRPGHVVVTNGVEIHATLDGGCSWTKASFPQDESLVPELGLGEAKVVGRSVTQVRFGAQADAYVWAIGATDVATDDLVASQPRVLYSRDGGRSFAARVTGLPQLGRPVAIQGYSATQAALLFRPSVPSSSAYTLYTTTDAGLSWTEDITGLPQLDDLVMAGDRYWAWNSSGLYLLAADRATKIPAVVGAVSAVTVYESQVAVFLASGTQGYVSYDFGLNWWPTRTPESVNSASIQQDTGLLAVSSIETNVLIAKPQGGNADFSPWDDNVADVQFVSSVTPEGYPLYAYAAEAVYERMVPYTLEPPEPPPVVELTPPKKRIPPKASIEPERKVVRLKQGESKVVDYRVSLPPVPTPLDVFFMTDSTGSMRSTIASVQEGVQNIIDGLAATGVDLNFGIADFRDYPEQPADGNYAYKVHRVVGPIDTDLEDALQGLTTGGGTTDGDDAALEAIYQAVTGAGRTDPLVARGELIPRGLDAGFRAEAMKVVLVASDDGMRHPGAANPTYPGPSLATVRDALRERGVYLVGIEVDSGSGDTPREELEELAEATGAIAPPQGVDCDSDGISDVSATDPLVCEFDPRAGTGIADAFISMLSGIKDLAPIDLAVDAPSPYVTPQSALHFPDVNVKAPNTFELAVEFTCTKKNAGTDTPVTIRASRTGTEVVRTTALLRCLAPPVPKPPLPEPLPPAVIPAVLIPPLVPAAAPPAPINNPPPNTNPNPNPNPNPQGGFAAQEEEQLQLALAENEFGVDYETDLDMTGLDRTGPPVPALAWAAAFAMTGAAAFGIRRARRTNPAPAFNPREYR